MVFWFNEDIKHQWEVLSSMYNFSPFPILPRIHPWLTVAMLSSLMQYHHIILHHNSCFGMSHNVGPCLIVYVSRQPRRPLRWLQLRGGSGGCGAAAALRPRVRVRHPVQGGEHPGHDDAEMLRRKMHDAGERQHHEHPGEPPQGLRQDRAPLLPLRWVFHSNQPGIYKYLLSM